MVKLLLDLDGTLVDFVGGAIKYHNLPIDIYNRPENLGEFDIVKLSGISPQEFWEPLGYNFWLNLSWIDEGKEILELCEEVIGSENICILTSPIITSGCLQGKIDWIAREMPKYKRSFLIGPRKEFCARADNILIDDSDSNVSKFIAHGGRSILVPRPWNSQYENRYKVLEVVGKCLREKV